MPGYRQQTDTGLTDTKRDYRFDNIKLILILLVIFGHLLELVPGAWSGRLYHLIYSFHMPAFIFVSGLFAKFDARKFLARLVLPYFVFQFLYTLFIYILSHSGDKFSVTFVAPYWIMWYLLALICYYLMVPVLQGLGRRWVLIVFVVTIVVSLLAGYDGNLGYAFSLSRTVVFLPFFVGGYCCSNVIGMEKIDGFVKRYRLPVAGLSFVAVAGLVYLVFLRKIPEIAMYGSNCYALTGTGIADRAILGLCAVAWIVLFISVVPNIKIPALSYVGMNTMPVFLLHGFIIKLILNAGIFKYSTLINLGMAAGLAVAIVLLLGNKAVASVFNFLFRRG